MIITFILPLISVIIGYLFLITFKKVSNISHLVTFSGAFVLSLVFFDILPHIYQHIFPTTIGFLIMSGILLQVFLEFFSKGIEHGHPYKGHKELQPHLLFLALTIHALLEGVPMRASTSVLIGITLHKLPIAIILGSYLFNCGYSSIKVFSYLFLFSLITPLGSVIGIYFSVIKLYEFEILAIVVGILFHISTTILFESSKGHKFNIQKLIIIILGIAVASFV